MSETIAAPATAPGESGIAVIRVSGERALAVSSRLFERSGRPLPSSPESHRVYYGWFSDPDEGARFDDGLLTYFAGPNSYTGEDVVELSCHGGSAVVSRLLRLLIAGGARLADPGEFTQRAFLNGRLDLAQAEAVIDLIRARTEASLKVAASQRSGRLSQMIAAMWSRLIDLLAEIEAAIDFPDDVEPPADDELALRAAAVRDQASGLLSTAPAGRLYREGALVVLAGAPNAGKSSLLNALLGENRAIVTAVPGTTRDTLEEGLNLRGAPVRLVDTAGIRATDDLIEGLGVARAREQVERADLVVWVVDGSRPAAEEELDPPVVEGQPLLVAIAKSDLPARIDAAALLAQAPRSPSVRVSAVTGDGLPELLDELAALLPTAGTTPEAVAVSNSRHIEQLHLAVAALDRAAEAARAGFDQVAIALDLKLAAGALGDITGESVTEETITRIFARFCVGK